MLKVVSFPKHLTPLVKQRVEKLIFIEEWFVCALVDGLIIADGFNDVEVLSPFIIAHTFRGWR